MRTKSLLQFRSWVHVPLCSGFALLAAIVDAALGAQPLGTAFRDFALATLFALSPVALVVETVGLPQASSLVPRVLADPSR